MIVINGGFGLVLDGSAEIDEIAKSMLAWDVYNGIFIFFKNEMFLTNQNNIHVCLINKQVLREDHGPAMRMPMKP